MNTSELLKKVRKIEIKARGLSSHLFTGGYHSAFKGRGMSFSEVRAYHPGDDVRAIDWNVTARTGYPYIKRYREERELTVMLVVDASGSGDFGTTGQFKRELAAEMASVLSFSATTNKDKVGLMIFTDQVELYIPPRKGRKHVLRLIRELLAFQLEVNMADVGLLALEDAESGQVIWVDTGDPAWRKQFSHQTGQFKQAKNKALATAGVDRVPIQTDQDYVKALTLFFQKRAQRIRH